MSRLLHVVAILVVLGIVLPTATGCQPLWGGKPERLRNPEKKKRPPGAEVQVKYVDDCKADFFADASRVKPRPNDARPLIELGDAAMTQAEQAKDPMQKSGRVVDAINKYKNALVKDPYNAEATYRLAVAYAHVLRKGCSLALLKRLTALEKNPAYETAAHRMIAAGTADSAFKGFRKDADSALGQ